MSLVSAPAVFAKVAHQVPEACRRRIVVIGSLAAAYQLLAEREDALVRTKDVDCMLVPRVEAVRAGKSTADALLSAGWRHPSEGPYAAPGTARTPDDALPVVRLYPPDSNDWYIELLSVLPASDKRDRAFDRIVLSDGHYAVASFRYLDLAAHQPTKTPEGLGCATLPMLVLSSLLRNPTIRPERMAAPGSPGWRRSNKDLGRVITIARLAGRDAAAGWSEAWVEALRTLYSGRWAALAARAGDGIRALLGSEVDLREAHEVSSVGLLAHAPATREGFRAVAARLLVDAIEPLEGAGQRALGRRRRRR
jgi:hypothetical protein